MGDSTETNSGAALVDRYLAGDPAAFGDLMISYERRIYRKCYQFVQNTEDAKDLTQEVFIKAFENLRKFRRQSSLKSWLYRIAINHCINYTKKNCHAFVEIGECAWSVQSAVHDRMEEQERRDQLRLMIKCLPPKQKQVVLMRIDDDLPVEEIAQITGRAVATIKVTVFLALQRLRKLAKEPA